MIMEVVIPQWPMRRQPAKNSVVFRALTEAGNCFSTIASFTTLPPSPRGRSGLQRKSMQASAEAD
jgi:hypothetical protein